MDLPTNAGPKRESYLELNRLERKFDDGTLSILAQCIKANKRIFARNMKI